MKIGFENFCKDHNFSGEITADFKNREIKKGGIHYYPTVEIWSSY
jgi:hypothetical protein